MGYRSHPPSTMGLFILAATHGPPSIWYSGLLVMKAHPRAPSSPVVAGGSRAPGSPGSWGVLVYGAFPSKFPQEKTGAGGSCAPEGATLSGSSHVLSGMTQPGSVGYSPSQRPHTSLDTSLSACHTRKCHPGFLDVTLSCHVSIFGAWDLYPSHPNGQNCWLMFTCLIAGSPTSLETVNTTGQVLASTVYPTHCPEPRTSKPPSHSTLRWVS